MLKYSFENVFKITTILASQTFGMLLLLSREISCASIKSGHYPINLAVCQMLQSDVIQFYTVEYVKFSDFLKNKV